MLEPAGCDALYLSPHLDDAALSCGGQIEQLTRAGRRVLVVTLFAGEPPTGEPSGALSPLAEKLHALWGLSPEAALAARRGEDLEACRVLGAEPVHWHLLDALYRRHPMTGAVLYPRLGDLFGAPADPELAEQIALRLAELPPAERIVAPLGAGGHVDHRLTRRAAERVFGSRLAYYEDFPYARKRRALWRALLGGGGMPWSWRSEAVALDEQALARKCEAVAGYGSQIGSLFGSHEAMEQQIRAFAGHHGRERVWFRNTARVSR